MATEIIAKKGKIMHIFLMLLAGLIALIAIAILASFLWLRTSLPKYSGNMNIGGIKSNVQIIRDKNAIPHVFAKNREDAYFAMGFVHAQDRLWALEMTRRAGLGRISEAVGDTGLPTDKFVAALDLDKIAAETDKRNNPETRAAISAYVKGINAGIDNHKGALPPEFLLLGLKPEHWTDTDVNRLGGLASLGSGNWREEMMRAKISTKINCEKLYDLYSKAEENSAITYPEINPQNGIPAKSCGAFKFKNNAQSGISNSEQPNSGRAMPESNSWAISGIKTISGKPFLANDPHGPLGAPADYYPIRMTWGDGNNKFELIGASRPGSPVIASGRNPYIAWGVTDIMADQTDIFIEKLDPKNHENYLTENGSIPFATKVIEIPIKGGKTEKVKLRYSRHGIVISDIDDEAAQFLKDNVGSEYVLSLSGLDFENGNPLIKAFMGMAEARDWDSFYKASREFGLQHNFSYADRKGNVGMVTVGHLPKRKGDGFMPVPAWNNEFAWEKYLAPDEWPYVFNPKNGFVANANNRLTNGKGGQLDYPDYEHRWRIGRITSLLSSNDKIDLKGMINVQTDTISEEVKTILPIIANAKPQTVGGKQMRELLLNWNGNMSKDLTQPLLWTAWQRIIGKKLIEPVLGKDTNEWLKNNRPRFDKLLTKNSLWCDDSPTLVAKSLDEAAALLNKEIGGDMTKWKWGKFHKATFKHEIFSEVPLISSLVTIRVPASGNADTINAGQTKLWGDDPWSDIYGPRYRQIIDLDKPENSLFMISPGISGNPFSPYFGHLAKAWSNGEYFTITGSIETLSKGKKGELTLKPN
jgi:penicillin amidase